jgi:hypothetical protein
VGGISVGHGIVAAHKMPRPWSLVDDLTDAGPETARLRQIRSAADESVRGDSPAGEVSGVSVECWVGGEARARINLGGICQADRLGMMTLDPGCAECAIDLEFTNGLKRNVCLIAISLTEL